MKYVLFICSFSCLAALYGQQDPVEKDSVPLKFGNLSVSSPHGILYRPVNRTGGSLNHFLQKPFVWKDSLEWNDCLAVSGDSLFSGIVKDTTSFPGKIVTTAYSSGKPTGEKLEEQQELITGKFFPVFYSNRTDDHGTAAFSRYNSAGVLIEQGCFHLPECPKLFENFFGSDNPDCIYKTYYDNGLIKLSFTLRGGRFDGDYNEYYTSGQLKEHRSYILGMPVGKWKRYSETGRITERISFRNHKARGKWSGDY